MDEPKKPATPETAATPATETPAAELPQEFGGSKLPLEPTRYGDWERNGRCYDF